MRKRKQQKNDTEEMEFTISSGNVYADFGFANPEKEEAKADLAMLIKNIIKSKNMTQQCAAELMGIDQPKVSKITRGLLTEFSIETLMNLLVMLGYDIKIEATPHKSKTSSPAIHFVPSLRVKSRRMMVS
jgi:predicted XRE-type DNA-binding protein